MVDSATAAYAHLEVVFSDRPRQVVRIGELPFFIGRGSDKGNHLALDDPRISRKCVAISAASEGLRIEDRGQRGGVFVNGQQISEGRILCNGDRIQLGPDDGCQLVFLSPSDDNRRETMPGLVGARSGDSHSELNRLTVLLEATSLLHSQLPLESILATMLDHIIAITRADRGILLEPDASGALQVKVARDREHETLGQDKVNPSRTVIRQAIEQRSAVINEDLRLADLNVQHANSVIMQFLRSAVVIPLYSVPRGNDLEAQEPAQDELLGALYLDSKRTAAFSALDRQILDALGVQAASILDNARLMQRERERQRLDQELSIARQMQQALVPQGLQDYPHFAITGIHHPCHEVGGDYFDVFSLPDGRAAILIADVAGKGLGAALLTAMLQGSLSGMTLGVEPVKVLEHLNRFLCDRAIVGRHATMFFGLVDPDGTFEFVRAGHPSPLLLRRGEVSELYTGGSFPIGLLEQASFTASRIQLEPDDTLLLFTDGVTEAEDKDRNLFGLVRLKDILVQHTESSLYALQSGILRAMEKFSAGAKQSDDITLLAVRYRKQVDRIGAV